jgi:2-amino-4-hydroxy-6-hydroxymethyldihydropteridine diphosphokinase
VAWALAAGCAPDQLAVDPGLGFGKAPRVSLALLRDLGALRALGLPLVVGPSRKGFIGRVLGPAEQHGWEGTAAAVALAIAGGADIVRVHDVARLARVVRMADAIVRTQHSVYLGLGSNLGDRAAHLAAALRGLEAAGVVVRRCSPLYETEPVGVREQPWFLNLVAEVETALSPTALLAAAKAVERAVGRTPGRRWGPRVVDVDILLYADWQVAETEPWLVIPHPEMWRRRFVLLPLRDLRPDLRAPDGTPLAAWLDALAAADPAVVRPWHGPLAWPTPDGGSAAPEAYP